MLDARSSLIAAAAAAGVTIGAVGWLLAGHDEALADVRSALNAAAPVRPATDDALPPSLAGASLFGSSGGAAPTVMLSGLARMPGRHAALLSIGGRPAVWIDEGQQVDGVILREVGGGQVTLDLPSGLVDLRLGETTGGAAPAAASPTQQAAASAVASGDAPPAGYRMPPPPASAPGGSPQEGARPGRSR